MNNVYRDRNSDFSTNYSNTYSMDLERDFSSTYYANPQTGSRSVHKQMPKVKGKICKQSSLTR